MRAGGRARARVSDADVLVPLQCQDALFFLLFGGGLSLRVFCLAGPMVVFASRWCRHFCYYSLF